MWNSQPELLFIAVSRNRSNIRNIYFLKYIPDFWLRDCILHVKALSLNLDESRGNDLVWVNGGVSGFLFRGKPRYFEF